MGLAIYEGARGSKFVCDTDDGFGDWVAMVSKNADAPISSCAREQAARPYLNKLGKMDQQKLWDCSQNCVASCHGNCNPANPPGKSTHERRNDGIAYPQWRTFIRLPVWGRGIDVQIDRVPAFIEEARRQGAVVTLTYPGSPRESQHVNVRKQPKYSLWKVRPVSYGAGGPRAVEVIKILKYIHTPQDHPYLDPKHVANRKIDHAVVAAIKAWQKNHHQKVDGVVGLHTIQGLRGQKRHRDQKLKVAAAIAKKDPVRVGVPRHISRGAEDVLIEFEGLRLNAYHLAGEKYWTIGVGHYGPDVHKGMVITRARAMVFLHSDVARFEDAVTVACVHAGFKPNQNQFDALVVFTFNLGPGVLDKGRSMGDAIRAKNPARISAAFLLYNRDSTGNVSAGLVRRRAAERKLFNRK